MTARKDFSLFRFSLKIKVDYLNGVTIIFTRRKLNISKVLMFRNLKLKGVSRYTIVVRTTQAKGRKCGKADQEAH
jgi:acetolactate synthase small subunit